MKSVFRKIAIVAIAMFTVSVSVNAQEKGDMAAGGNLVIGSGDSFTNFGVGAKFQYNVINPLRLEASFTYFIRNDYITMWDMSFNAHWLFKMADRINLYPLAGLGILNSGADYGLAKYGVRDTSESDFAVNIGGGIDFKLTDKLILNSELKYKFSDPWDRLLFSVGVAYRF